MPQQNIPLENVNLCWLGCNKANLMALLVLLWSLFSQLQLIGLLLKAGSASRPCTIWNDHHPDILPPTLCCTHSHKRVPEAYATVEGACFTSRCFGGWITLVLHVRQDQMTPLCVSKGWTTKRNSAGKQKFLSKSCVNIITLSLS